MRARLARAALPAAAAVSLAALSAAGLLASGAAPAVGGPAPAPNVVVIMTDDQNAGGEVEIMRHVTRELAGRGVTFKRFYATFPLCCPSRATYLTGQYAHNHGVLSNHPDAGGGFQAFDDSQTTAVALDDAGYRVAQVGHFLNGYPSVARTDPTVIPAGFDRWFVPLSGSMYGWRADDQGVIKDYVGRSEYQTDVLRRKGLAFMRHTAASGQPFWLTLAPRNPHGEPSRHRWPNPRPAPQDFGKFDDAPLPRPPSFNERNVSDKPEFLQRRRLTRSEVRTLRKRYQSRLASLLAVDRLVGALVAEARELGILDRTWFIFTSDNGYLLGEHRLRGKRLLYEESARVPLIIRGPRGTLPQGVVRRQITGNIDISPTILDITGVSPILDVDGVSLLPFAADPSHRASRSILFENATSKAVRARRWMYAEHDVDADPGADEFELYDMHSDPYQLRNLYTQSLDAVDHPDLAAVRERLEARLAQLRDCAGHSAPDPCD